MERRLEGEVGFGLFLFDDILEPANLTQEELDALETITSAEWMQSIRMQSAALWSSSPDDTLEDLERRAFAGLIALIYSSSLVD